MLSKFGNPNYRTQFFGIHCHGMKCGVNIQLLEMLVSFRVGSYSQVRYGFSFIKGIYQYQEI
jgi:hypothetical protein